jgi:hypothetical protein
MVIPSLRGVLRQDEVAQFVVSYLTIFKHIKYVTGNLSEFGPIVVIPVRGASYDNGKSKRNPFINNVFSERKSSANG